MDLINCIINFFWDNLYLILHTWFSILLLSHHSTVTFWSLLQVRRVNKLLGKVEEGAKKLANHQVCFFVLFLFAGDEDYEFEAGQKVGI